MQRESGKPRRQVPPSRAPESGRVPRAESRQHPCRAGLRGSRALELAEAGRGCVFAKGQKWWQDRAGRALPGGRLLIWGPSVPGKAAGSGGVGHLGGVGTEWFAVGHGPSLSPPEARGRAKGSVCCPETPAPALRGELWSPVTDGTRGSGGQRRPRVSDEVHTEVPMTLKPTTLEHRAERRVQLGPGAALGTTGQRGIPRPGISAQVGAECGSWPWSGPRGRAALLCCCHSLCGVLLFVLK